MGFHHVCVAAAVHRQRERAAASREQARRGAVGVLGDCERAASRLKEVISTTSPSSQSSHLLQARAALSLAQAIAASASAPPLARKAVRGKAEQWLKHCDCLPLLCKSGNGEAARQAALAVTLLARSPASSSLSALAVALSKSLLVAATSQDASASDAAEALVVLLRQFGEARNSVWMRRRLIDIVSDVDVYTTASSSSSSSVDSPRWQRLLAAAAATISGSGGAYCPDRVDAADMEIGSQAAEMGMVHVRERIRAGAEVSDDFVVSLLELTAALANLARSTDRVCHLVRTRERLVLLCDLFTYVANRWEASSHVGDLTLSIIARIARHLTVLNEENANPPPSSSSLPSGAHTALDVAAFSKVLTSMIEDRLQQKNPRAWGSAFSTVLMLMASAPRRQLGDSKSDGACSSVASTIAKRESLTSQIACMVNSGSLFQKEHMDALDALGRCALWMGNTKKSLHTHLETMLSRLTSDALRSLIARMSGTGGAMDEVSAAGIRCVLLFALSSTAALTVIAAALPREWRRAAVDEDGAIKTAPFDDSITFLVESIGGLRSLTPRQWKYSPRVADCDLLSVLFLCAGAGHTAIYDDGCAAARRSNIFQSFEEALGSILVSCHNESMCYRDDISEYEGAMRVFEHAATALLAMVQCEYFRRAAGAPGRVEERAELVVCLRAMAERDNADDTSRCLAVAILASRYGEFGCLRALGAKIAMFRKNDFDVQPGVETCAHDCIDGGVIDHFEEEFMDVSFVLGDGSVVRGNSLVLAATCPKLLPPEFSSSTSSSTRAAIPLNKAFSSPAVRAFLDYVHTGRMVLLPGPEADACRSQLMLLSKLCQMPTLQALLRGDTRPTARDSIRPHTRAQLLPREGDSAGGCDGRRHLLLLGSGSCERMVPKLLLFVWSEYYRMRLMRHGSEMCGTLRSDDTDGIGHDVSEDGMAAFHRFCHEGCLHSISDTPQFLEDIELRSRLRVAHDLALIAQEKLVDGELSRVSEDIVEEIALLMGPEFVLSVVEEHDATFFTENVASYVVDSRDSDSIG